MGLHVPKDPMHVFLVQAGGFGTGNGVMLRIDITDTIVEITKDMMFEPIGDLHGRKIIRQVKNGEIKGYFAVPAGQWQNKFTYM